ncbi:unnamed protein product [Brassica rapa]|uniref:Uncharacterized protein n=2 Tax=Brassica TaxID=3705 RepID=A0A8D9HTN5_BRACM|nr:unnamed protein product [Brassica napus]CAG7905249.1 unnamed protein product [Brassica rapa]
MPLTLMNSRFQHKAMLLYFLPSGTATFFRLLLQTGTGRHYDPTPYDFCKVHNKMLTNLQVVIVEDASFDQI